MNIACIGDSTTAGCYADGVNNWAGNRVIAYPAYLSSILKSAGLPVNQGSVTADNSSIAHAGTIQSYDARCTVGASWGVAAGANTAGGQIIKSITGALGSTGAETFSFAPVESFDTVDVYWYRGTVVPTFTIDCGGAVLATCVAGASGLQKTTVSKTAGAGVVNIIRTTQTAGNINLLAIFTSLSTAPAINVHNLGWSGARASYWNDSSAGYSPIPMLLQYAPDLAPINFGINDAISGFSQSSIVSNLLGIIAAVQASGDAVLIIPNAVDVSIASEAAQAVATAAILEAAATAGVPVMSINGRWGGYASSDALGYMNTDKTHPKKSGLADVAAMLADFVLGH